MIGAVGRNGFLVSAYPVDSEDAKERIKKQETKKTVILQLDFRQGPIWLSYFERVEPSTGIAIIDNNPKIRELNWKIADMYDDYYEFDSHDMPCWFNEEKEKNEKDKMLSLVKQLNDRLAEINGGSFMVDDRLTDYYKNLWLPKPEKRQRGHSVNFRNIIYNQCLIYEAYLSTDFFPTPRMIFRSKNRRKERI